MPTDEEFERLITVTDQQKGELLFLQTILVSLFRAMPRSVQTDALNRFDKAAEAVRASALHSEAGDQVLASFDHYAANVDKLLLS